MNPVTLTGYLGADREIRSTTERTYTARYRNPVAECTDEYEVTVPGRDYIRFSLATHRRVGRQWKTEWHRVLCWNADKLSNFAVRILRKGDHVRVTGRYDEYRYVGTGGQERVARHLVLHKLEILRTKVGVELP